MRLFYYFNFERNYDVLSQRVHAKCWTKMFKLFLSFNKSGTEPKMENPTYSFTETNLVLIQESQIKTTIAMSWSSRKKEEGFFCTVYFVQRWFFLYLCFISMYNVLGTLSIKIYILLDIKKHYFMHFLLVFKIVESPQCILNTQMQLTFWEIHMLIYWQFVKLKLTIVSQTVSFSTSEVSARYSDLTEIKLTVE